MTVKIDSLLEEITFGPGASDLYSTTGCKRVGPKVDILLEDTLLKITKLTDILSDWIYDTFSSCTEIFLCSLCACLTVIFSSFNKGNISLNVFEMAAN